MVNKCVICGCKSGYKTCDEKVSHFEFPFKRPQLLEKWVKFVNRRDWKPTKNSVICIKHFKEEFICHGKKNALKWESHPIPTIHTEKALKRHSVVQTPAMPRKAPKIRTYQNDEMEEFSTKNAIKRFEDLKESDASSENSCHRTEDYILYYHIVFWEITAFPRVKGAIKIDKTLCVQLQFQGCDVPLPQWFVNGRNGKLTSFSMLHNFPAYLRGFTANRNTILEEMMNKQYYKPKGRKPYSSQLLRFALLVRYTSGQAYKLLLEDFPLSSFSCCKNLKEAR